jgi:hypothetical protein
MRMTTRERLIEEIRQAPEDLLQPILDYLLVERRQRSAPPPIPQKASGLHAAYWNQFIGVFAGEEWERPPQDLLEPRPAW